MSLENVRWLPNWRKDVDAATRFEELAVMAHKHPEKFAHVFVGWSSQPKPDERGYSQNYCLVGCRNDTMTLLGLLEMLRMEIHEQVRK